MAIIESNKISHVLHYVNQETLVIFDIDNTLIMPASHVGSTAWFEYMIEKYQLDKLEIEKMANNILETCSKNKINFKIKTVEQNTSLLINQLHEQKIKTLGLTGRNFSVAQYTNKQLDSVNITLHNNTIYEKDVIFNANIGFSCGTLSASLNGNKGEILISFFEKIEYAPKKIIFIDDKRLYLNQVEKAIRKFNIEFMGIHYGCANNQLLQFDPARADKELEDIMQQNSHYIAKNWMLKSLAKKILEKKIKKTLSKQL